MSDSTGTDSKNESVMDYAEHERTFDLFIAGTKWLSAATVCLLIAMAFGFFAGGGLFGGIIVFLLLMIVAWFML